jgi:hypothetical protein
MVVGSHQKCASTTSWVEDFVILGLRSQAKLKDDIHNIRIGEILTEIVPFILGDESLKDPTDDFVFKLGKVILPQSVHQLPYFFHYTLFVRKSDGINEICGINSLIVYLENTIEIALQS